MTFESPVALWGLLLVPAAVVLWRVFQQRRARFAINYPAVPVLASVMPSGTPRRRLLPPVLYLAALSALILGLGRPHAALSVPRDDATVVLVMDTSGSMEAADVRPTRLAAARSSARAFLAQLPPRFQVGLVAFADRAQVLAQPTIDRIAVREAIDSLEPEGGTAMGDALARALSLGSRRGEASEPGRRDAPLDAVLLLSDGFNTTGRVEPMEAAARASRRGVPTFTIALGTPEGVVQTRDQFGRRRLINVPPDHDTLEAIADVTGGSFFEAPTEDDLRRVYEDLGSRIGYVKERREVTAAFAGAALVLAALAGGLSLAWTGRLP